ncbi:flagellar hook-length control protein FliK [Palleronia sediminis]|uniref:Flagellar hook-length control protein FliK n=1 Tax=Palleronia sediminis TaxID=2547833 RepID=A0A4R6AEP6_9RHOB|nr:flagellar hook-length control protein FliK [Palleronia sediminis]TDL81532.1 flagellar hook-length control protein FliK [Palleronia sediminis]
MTAIPIDPGPTAPKPRAPLPDMSRAAVSGPQFRGVLESLLPGGASAPGRPRPEADDAIPDSHTGTGVGGNAVPADDIADEFGIVLPLAPEPAPIRPGGAMPSDAGADGLGLPKLPLREPDDPVPEMPLGAVPASTLAGGLTGVAPLTATRPEPLAPGKAQDSAIRTLPMAPWPGWSGGQDVTGQAGTTVQGAWQAPQPPSGNDAPAMTLPREIVGASRDTAGEPPRIESVPANAAPDRAPANVVPASVPAPLPWGAMPSRLMVAPTEVKEPAAPLDALPVDARIEAVPRMAQPAEMRSISQIAAQTDRPPVAQIADAVLRRVGDEIEVSLHPAELGRVRIAVSQTETGLGIVITAERDDTAAFLRRQGDALGAALGGLNLGSVDIGFGDGRGGRDKDDGSGTPFATGSQPVDGGDRPVAMALVGDSVDLRM